jgi:hypothetical protein
MCTLFGCRQLSRRNRFETLVRDRLSADDRKSVRTVCQSLLGSLDGGQLLVELLGTALRELILKQLRGQVGSVELLRFNCLALVGVHRLGKLSLDPRAFRSEELACSFGVHDRPQPLFFHAIDESRRS